MKKLITVLGILAVVVVGGGPFISGMLVEQRYHELLEEGAFSDVVKLHSQSYERGWMSSTIITEVEVIEAELVTAFHAFRKKAGVFAGIESGDPRPLFKVESIVQHGPFWFGEDVGMGLGQVDSHLILDDETHTKIAAVFEDEILSMQVTVNFNRTADVSLNTSKAAFADEESGEMGVIQPVLSHWRIAKLGNDIKGEITWEGFSFTSKKGRASLSGTTIKTDMQHYHGLWIGSAVMDQEVAVFDGRDGKLSIKGLHLDADSDVNAVGDLAGSSMSGTVQSMDISGEVYGPGSCRISVANLPVDTWAKVQQLQNEMAHSALRDPAGYPDISASMKMLTMLPELLSRGPVIEVSELNLVTPHGDVQGRLKIVLPETSPERLMNPSYLKKIIQIDADLTVPADYFRGVEAAQTINKYTQSGFIENRDGMLHTTLHMVDGQLTINGKPVALPF